jgi:ATP-binding cassette subfamily F protein 3
MLLNASNVLILDEPTNHLDLDSKEVLLEALEDYGGTLIFVSHDRYFVDKLATKVIEVGGGQTLVYPGGYEDFVYWKKQREAGVAVALPTASAPAPHVKHDKHDKPKAAPRPAASAPAPAASAKKENTKPAPSPAAASGNGQAGYDPLAPRLRPTNPADRQAREREGRKLKARIAELEKKIAEKEQAVRDVEHLMATPGFYDDRARAEEAVGNRQRLLDEVAALMSEWEAVQAEFDGKGLAV